MVFKFSNPSERIVSFSKDTKEVDGTSKEVLMYAKLFCGYFKIKNYENVKNIDDVLKITDNLYILEFCIEKSQDLLNILIQKEIDIKRENHKIINYPDKNYPDKIYNISVTTQIESGHFISKILYPNGKIYFAKNKYPLYFNNESNKIEIDWEHNFFNVRSNNFKVSDRVPIILCGSRDIRQSVSIKFIPFIRNFIKLLENTQEYLFFHMLGN